jgi:hypothetical protein
MNGVTREGYTFQTVLGSMGLNHMNGRIEDSVTGRFLSPDTRGTRICDYVEGIKYFIWLGPSYPVIFEREGPISPEMRALRLAIPQYLAKRDKSD